MSRHVASSISTSNATCGHEESPSSQSTASGLRLSRSLSDTALPGYQKDSDRVYGHDSQEPFTSRLGISKTWDNVFSSRLTVISDAGEKQYHEQMVGFEAELGLQSHDDEDDFPSPASPCTVKHKLQKSILDAMQIPTTGKTDHGLGFVPKRQLQLIIHHESVRRELLSSCSFPPEQTDALVSVVCSQIPVQRQGKMECKTFVKIFALLALLEMSELIPLFLNEDVSDLELPLINVGSRLKVDLRCKDDQGKPGREVLKCVNI